jgi:ABC-2 type transport system permease protein
MRNELLQFTRMRSVLLILFIMPLLLIFVLGSALSSQFKAEDYVPAPAKLAVFNEDSGQMKAPLQQFFAKDQVREFLQVTEVQSEEEMNERIESNEVDGGLVIPASFSKQMMSGSSSDWTYYGGSNTSANDTIKMLLQTFADQTTQTQAAVMVLGPQAAAVSAPVDRTSQVVQGTLQDNLYNASAMEYYAGSMLIMFLLFSGMSAAISLQKERENKTLQRIMVAPVTVAQALLGKLLGVAVLSMIQCSVIIIFTWVVYGVNWGEHLGAIAIICLCTIVAAISLAAILAVIFKSSKAVESVYSSLVTIMTFLSGGMMVFVGDQMQTVGQFTLNYWAAGAILRFMLNVDTSTAWNNLYVLIGIAVALMAGAMLISRRVVTLHE